MFVLRVFISFKVERGIINPSIVQNFLQVHIICDLERIVWYIFDD